MKNQQKFFEERAKSNYAAEEEITNSQEQIESSNNKEKTQKADESIEADEEVEEEQYGKCPFSEVRNYPAF